MPTICLRNDVGASLSLLSCDGDEDMLSRVVAMLAERAPRVDFATTPAGLVRDQVAKVLAAFGLDSETVDDDVERRSFEAISTTFDRLTIVDDDVVTDFSLCEFGSADTTKRDYHGRWTTGPAGGRTGPRTEAQAGFARQLIGDALNEAGTNWGKRSEVLGKLDANGDASTVALHDRLKGGRWTDERSKLHKLIIDEHLAAAANVPKDSEAILVGGLPGSGKSTALKADKLGVDKTRFMHLDPDEVKKELLARNAIDRVPGMSDGEHAALLHEESGYIIDRLHEIAVSRGINVIIDKTMSGPPQDEIRVLRKHGYHVRGVFVDVPIDESLASAKDRWKRGGRFIPPAYIEQSRRADGHSKNLRAFQSVSDQFDDWTVVNNKGISKKTPLGTIKQGTGKYEFASDGIVVFRADVARDWHGRWAVEGQPGDAHADGDIIVDGGTVRVSAAAAPALVEDLGNRPGSSDLTKVTIAGHPNLFGSVARNQLRRVDMPQIPSERLDDFDAYLRERGIKTSLERVDPATLRATQNELDGRKVGQMLTAMRLGTMSTKDKPLWVAADDRILDGHHRWAAEAILSVAADMPRAMTVNRVHAPMVHLLAHARAFAAENQIDSKSHGMAVNRMSLSQRVTRFEQFAAEAVPRDWHGRWSAGAGGVGNGLPTPVQFAGMDKTGGPLGSQGGGWYRDEHGQKYLVKPAQSRTHAMNELAAHLLYKAAGVPTDDTGIYADGDKWFIAKKAIQSPDGKLGQIIGDDITPEMQRQAQDGFAVDALASSWDAYGLVGDNVLMHDGTLYRIDVGGSGMFRAMGGPKATFNPGHPWTEPDSLRTSNQGKQLYGHMSDADAALQLDKLRHFNVDGFAQLLTDTGIDHDVRNTYVDTVRDRIGSQLPGILDRLRS